MTGSRTDLIGRLAATLGGVLLASLLLMDAATAQQQPGQPLRLAPRLLYPDSGAPVAPPAETPAAPEVLRQPAATGPNVPASNSDAAVKVDALATIDPDSAGTLTEDNGGLTIKLWEGSDWDLVRALTAALPVETTSPTLRDVMRRLLLTAAPPPQGKREPGSFMTLRLKELVSMGEISAANELFANVPGRDSNETLATIETDARFLLNDNARACTIASAQVARSDVDYWQKAFIFCQALAGEKAKATLGVDLMREAGNSDKAFFAIAGDLTSGRPAKLASLADPTPLHLAMARVAKDELPKDVLKTRSPAMLRAIATNPYSPVDVRLEAAERAETSGALAVDALRQLYGSVTFTEDELSNPLSKADARGGAAGRALLYRAALLQTIPTAKAEAAARAFALGRKDGRYASVVRAFQSILADIPPSDELAWFAPEATRALLVAGDLPRAQNWLRLLRANALFREEAKGNLAAVLPLAHLAGAESEQPWSGDDLTAWWEAVRTQDGAAGRASLLYTLLESIGDTVPPSLWTALLANSDRTSMTMPNPALWDRLGVAAEAKRSGETILLALACLGEDGTAAPNPVVLRRVLSSFKAVGLDKEARALTVEIAATAGL